MKCTEPNFVVNLATREARHSTGARATFREYQTEHEWLTSDVVIVHDPDFYPGLQSELAQLAKQAALKAGMKHRRA